MKLIVDALTGTIIDADTCYIVDTEELSAEDDALLSGGSDSEASEVAQRVGVSVSQMGRDTGWGDNRYSWTVSYSPLTLKEEAQEMLGQLSMAYGDGKGDDEGLYNALVWASEEASLAELGTLADTIMAYDEEVWHGWKRNFSENLVDFHSRLKD